MTDGWYCPHCGTEMRGPWRDMVGGQAWVYCPNPDCDLDEIVLPSPGELRAELRSRCEATDAVVEAARAVVAAEDAYQREPRHVPSLDIAVRDAISPLADALAALDGDA